MNKKNNLRFQETETRMEAAALQLMQRTDFERLTVRAVCEKAGVNRSTFYAHFTDIYDLLDKMESYLSRELLARYISAPPAEHDPFSKASFVPFLRHIKAHQYFYKITLQHRKSYPIKEGYEPLWALIRVRCEQAGIREEEKMLYYFIGFQAGFTMVLKHWVDGGCRESEEEIAAIIRGCIPAVLA